MRMVGKAIGYVEVPAGEYFLGDPCYAVPDALWMPLLESCAMFGASSVGTVDGFDVAGISTAYGDGCYKDQQGREYSVDAGMIGLVPAELAARADHTREELEDLGQFVTFAEPVVAADEDGKLRFGPYLIDTVAGGDEDEDEDEDEGWDDDQDWDDEDDPVL